jgi:hypothetical protein
MNSRKGVLAVPAMAHFTPKIDYLYKGAWARNKEFALSLQLSYSPRNHGYLWINVDVMDGNSR